MIAKIQALLLAKYKLSVVCQDEQVQKRYPEVAEANLAALQDIEQQIISLRALNEDIIVDENSYQPAGN